MLVDFFFQISSPVIASTANRFAFRSPKYTAARLPINPTLGADRTPLSA